MFPNQFPPPDAPPLYCHSTLSIAAAANDFAAGMLIIDPNLMPAGPPSRTFVTYITKCEVTLMTAVASQLALEHRIGLGVFYNPGGVWSTTIPFPRNYYDASPPDYNVIPTNYNGSNPSGASGSVIKRAYLANVGDRVEWSWDPSNAPVLLPTDYWGIGLRNVGAGVSGQLAVSFEWFVLPNFT